MNGSHKFAKYFATTLAVILIVSIVYGAVRIVKLIADKNGGGTSVSSETDDRQKSPSDESDPQTPASQADPTGTSEQREPLLPGDPTVPQEIEISVVAGYVDLKTGDAFDVDGSEAIYSITREGSKLKVTSSNIDLTKGVDRLKLTVTVPKNVRLQTVEVSLNAGRLTVRDVQTRNLKLELSAGSAELTSPDVSDKTEIRALFGSVQIQGGTLANLRMQSGAGATRISARLTGESTVECGAGALSLVLEGPRNDYTVSFPDGIAGKAYFNDRLVQEGASYPGGPNTVKISCGAGKVTVNTAE